MMTAQMNRPGHVIPSLDGLRALSVVLVLISHTTASPYFHRLYCARCFATVAILGVQTFFVISGFLITTLLLGEMNRTGGIRLSKFYYRRTLRIFPPFYAFLLILVVLGLVGYDLISGRSLFHAATYTTNYFKLEEWNTAHTWSLAAEEQFYLIWPAVLALLGRRLGLKAAIVAIFACPLVRVLMFVISRKYFHNELLINMRFEGVADAIAIGCVLAGFRDRLHASSRYMAMLRSRAFILAPLTAFVVTMIFSSQVRYPFLFYLLFGYSIVNFAVVLSIDWAVTFHSGRIGAILNSMPVVWVGVMSYSIYLWQQPLLNPDLTSNVFLRLLLVLPVAALSYYLVERPILRLRQRWERSLFPERQASNDPNSVLAQST